MAQQRWHGHLGATQELHVAYDTITEEPLTFQKVVGRAAQEFVSKLR